MPKNIFLKIDDDVSRALAKISREKTQELVLVLPKESWLLADVGNLKLLKRQIENQGKTFAIFTMDKDGLDNVRAAGIETRGMEVMRNVGTSVDMVSKKRAPGALGRFYPESAIKAEDQKIYQPLPTFNDRKNILESQQKAETARQENIYHDISEYRLKEQPKHSAVLSASEHKQNHPQTYQAAQTEQKQEDYAFAQIQQNQPKKTLLIEKNQPAYSYPPARPSYKKSILFLTVTFVLAAVFTGFVILPEADVIVYAHNQPISRNIEITIDKNAKEVNSKDLVLPAQIFEKDQSISQQFNSTGKQNVGIAAKGYVQIFNFTGKTLKFGAATTKFIAGKKTYHLEKDLNGIKATRKFPSGDIDKSSLIAEVLLIADQPGDDYNFPAGTRFEIENDILGSVPQLLYSQNTQAMAGGVTRLTNIVSADDISKAQKTLSDAVLAAAKQQLLNKSGLVLIESGANMQIKDIYIDKKAGDASLNFNGTISASIKALVFKKNDLQKLVRERITLTLDKGKFLAADDQAGTSSEFKSADLNLGSGILSVSYQGKVLSELNQQEIEAKIRGKSPEEVKQILLSSPEIDGVDLTLKPFWVRSVPNIAGKVYVSIEAK